MLLRAKLTPTRFPTNSLYTPMDNTPLHSMPSVCHPLGRSVIEGYFCERQHPFRIGGKDLEGWRRTSKDVLFRSIEPWAPSQRVCGGVEEIGVCFQQRSVVGSKERKEDRVPSVANGHAIFGPGEPAIHLRYPRVCWWWIY